MVVEDEDMIRRGIIGSVPWGELGFEVVGEGKNGLDALEKMKGMAVDVVLTDIKMPLMGGLEFSNTIRKLYPDIEIIVLSGFSDFEYARQAIRFRAFEYLLKPTNKTKLIDSFTALKEKLDKKKEAKEALFHKGIFINAGYDSMRNDFLASLLNGERHVFDRMDEQISYLELDFTGEFFTAATIRFDQQSICREFEAAWEKDKKLLMFSYRNIINEILGEIENAYAIVKEYDQIDFIFCFETREAQERQLGCSLENIVDYIKSCLFKGKNITSAIGIGLTYPSILQIGKSFHQAEKSILNNFFSSDQVLHVFHDKLESKYEQNWIEYYPKEMHVIASCVCAGDVAGTQRYIDLMFETMVKHKIMPEIIKNYCVVLKLMILSKSSLEDKQIEEMMGDQFTEIVRSTLSIQALRDYVAETLAALAGKIEAYVGDESGKAHCQAVEKSKEYIHQHYSEKITIKQISDEVFLSQNYFSALFRKATGMTYMDYIQKVRMDEAKRLLADPYYKVYEIAQKIGYSEYKYFALQFKKMVGMSPKEYRKNLGQ